MKLFPKQIDAILDVITLDEEGNELPPDRMNLLDEHIYANVMQEVDDLSGDNWIRYVTADTSDAAKATATLTTMFQNRWRIGETYIKYDPVQLLPVPHEAKSEAQAFLDIANSLPIIETDPQKWMEWAEIEPTDAQVMSLVGKIMLGDD